MEGLATLEGIRPGTVALAPAGTVLYQSPRQLRRGCPGGVRGPRGVRVSGPGSALPHPGQLAELGTMGLAAYDQGDLPAADRLADSVHGLSPAAPLDPGVRPADEAIEGETRCITSEPA